MRPIALTLALAIASLTYASEARAFITVDRFDLPAVEGGGGGLHFTGARADARTCGVCHVGGPSRSLSVLGLPASDIEPGRIYELSIDAADAARSAFALELEGREDDGLGTLEVPDPAMLAPEEQCSNGVPATSIVDAEGGRRVAVAAACGARLYRVLWTAPSSSSLDPALTLHGGVVLADDSGGPTGDSAVVLEVPLGREARARLTPAESGCAVIAAGVPPRGIGALVLASILALAWVVRALRRMRTSQPSTGPSRSSGFSNASRRSTDIRPS